MFCPSRPNDREGFLCFPAFDVHPSGNASHETLTSSGEAGLANCSFLSNACSAISLCAQKSLSPLWAATGKSNKPFYPHEKIYSVHQGKLQLVLNRHNFTRPGTKKAFLFPLRRSIRLLQQTERECGLRTELPQALHAHWISPLD